MEEKDIIDSLTAVYSSEEEQTSPEEIRPIITKIVYLAKDFLLAQTFEQCKNWFIDYNKKVYTMFELVNRTAIDFRTSHFIEKNIDGELILKHNISIRECVKNILGFFFEHNATIINHYKKQLLIADEYLQTYLKEYIKSHELFKEFKGHKNLGSIFESFESIVENATNAIFCEDRFVIRRLIAGLVFSDPVNIKTYELASGKEEVKKILKDIVRPMDLIACIRMTEEFRTSLPFEYEIDEISQKKEERIKIRKMFIECLYQAILDDEDAVAEIISGLEYVFKDL